MDTEEPENQQLTELKVTNFDNIDALYGDDEEGAKKFSWFEL